MQYTKQSRNHKLFETLKKLTLNGICRCASREKSVFVKCWRSRIVTSDVESVVGIDIVLSDIYLTPRYNCTALDKANQKLTSC